MWGSVEPAVEATLSARHFFRVTASFSTQRTVKVARVHTGGAEYLPEPRHDLGVLFGTCPIDVVVDAHDDHFRIQAVVEYDTEASFHCRVCNVVVAHPDPDVCFAQLVRRTVVHCLARKMARQCGDMLKLATASTVAIDAMPPDRWADALRGFMQDYTFFPTFLKRQLFHDVGIDERDAVYCCLFCVLHLSSSELLKTFIPRYARLRDVRLSQCA